MSLTWRENIFEMVTGGPQDGARRTPVLCDSQTCEHKSWALHATDFGNRQHSILVRIADKIQINISDVSKILLNDLEVYTMVHNGPSFNCNLVGNMNKGAHQRMRKIKRNINSVLVQLIFYLLTNKWKESEQTFQQLCGKCFSFLSDVPYLNLTWVTPRQSQLSSNHCWHNPDSRATSAPFKHDAWIFLQFGERLLPLVITASALLGSMLSLRRYPDNLHRALEKLFPWLITGCHLPQPPAIGDVRTKLYICMCVPMLQVVSCTSGKLFTD